MITFFATGEFVDRCCLLIPTEQDFKDTDIHLQHGIMLFRFSCLPIRYIDGAVVKANISLIQNVATKMCGP